MMITPSLDGDDVLIDEEEEAQLLLHIELDAAADHDARDLDQRDLAMEGVMRKACSSYLLYLVGESHQPHGLHVVGIDDHHRLGAELLRVDDLDPFHSKKQR
jgi:hypothetical protein